MKGKKLVIIKVRNIEYKKYFFGERWRPEVSFASESHTKDSFDRFYKSI
jgi:hypothetical protein